MTTKAFRDPKIERSAMRIEALLKSIGTESERLAFLDDWGFFDCDHTKETSERIDFIEKNLLSLFSEIVKGFYGQDYSLEELKDDFDEEVDEIVSLTTERENPKMSYSRWSNSAWYTFWGSTKSNKRNEQQFEICTLAVFTYEELKNDLEKCIDKVKELTAHAPHTAWEYDELRGYMKNFIEDVQSDESLEDF